MISHKKSQVSRISAALHTNLILIIILCTAVILWAWIFTLASSEFLEGSTRPLRAVWSGTGHFELFGMTIYYDFEGYADYDYYYYSWGEQFVNGIPPYTDLFNTIEFNTAQYQTPYFFPPLFVYMCALGMLLPINPFGIAFLLAMFGFLTAFPIYGISRYLSQNPHVAEISVATYLFNPIILYHTVYSWLNPSPFVFFMILSFYLLMRGNRLTGVLAMTTAALLKQTAFFMALPLVAFLLVKRVPSDHSSTPDEEPRRKLEFDLRGFARYSVYTAVYVLAISFPYVLNLGNYLYYIFQRPGAFLIEDITTLPDVSQPITITVLLILLGAPAVLTELVNQATYLGVFLTISMCAIFLLMFLLKREHDDVRIYWRKMFLLSLLLMFCVHLFSPRGIYKYYCVALIPFISVLSVSRMFSAAEEPVRPTLFMVLNPMVFSVLILFPTRYVYLFFLILLFVGYVLHKQFSLFIEMANQSLKRVFSYLRLRSKGIPGTEFHEDTEEIPNPHS
ncbi:MAG: hypothetical protein JW779_12655 [Candidatus Thorarchaeota archaeon]|nr:hypothetical protein [Candidatus Thorarchaeota archaeon]